MSVTIRMRKAAITVASGWMLFGCAALFALPFNDDMVGKQMITGTIMRPKPAHSVPIGTSNRHVESREAALTLQNPQRGDTRSPVRGERLYRVFCGTCHGVFSDTQWTPSAILDKGMPAINLGDENIWYFDPDKKERLKPDGHYFGYVSLGGLALMPAYGWKLSNTEIWDVVNYVRQVQRKVAASKGMALTLE